MEDTKRARCAEDSEDEDDPLLRERLSKFDPKFIAKGEDVIDIKFLDDWDEKISGQTFKPWFTHQLFDDSRVCGFLEPQVDLIFESKSWALVGAHERFLERKESAEKAPLASMQSQECLRPIFMDKEVISPLPGRHLWEDGAGTIIKFVDCLDAAAKRLLKRGLALSTFYIERASQVDVDDAGWKLLLIIERFEGHERLVGFTSLYEFHNPIKNKRSIRVCVMFVRPGYQRKRLGEKMLEAVYRLAGESDDVSEVTVEDPCEAFSTMRERVEIRLCHRNGLFFNDDIERFEQARSPLVPSTVQSAQDELKFSDNQIQFCFECAWLHKLRQEKVDGEETKNKETFRRSVKNRIRKRPGDIVIPDNIRYPDEFKQVLQSEYLIQIEKMSKALQGLPQ